jgi:hypothetical protein
MRLMPPSLEPFHRRAQAGASLASHQRASADPD